MSQTTDLTTLAADLKELYTLPPQRLLNDKSFLHNKLTKEQAVMDASGKYTTWPNTIRRSLGRGSRGDSAILPDAIAEVVVSAQAPIKRHYHTLEWSDAIEQASKNKEGAFESVVTMKMRNLALDLAKDVNRQWYNGSLGQLGVVATGANSASQTLTSVQYINVGDKIEIHSATGSATRAGTPCWIATKNKATKVITLVDSAGSAQVVNTTTGDILAVAGSVVAGSPATNYEVEGLRFICDTGRTLHNINSTTYPEWDGVKKTLTGQVAGESLFEQLYDDVGENGRGDIDLYLATRGERRRLVDEFASQRRWVNEKTTDIAAGFDSIEVNGKPCVIDDDCPKGEVFALSTETLKVLQMTEPGFVQSSEGNARIELKVNGDGQHLAVYQAFYRYYMTLVCTDPARNGRITGAADD